MDLRSLLAIAFGGTSHGATHCFPVLALPRLESPDAPVVVTGAPLPIKKPPGRGVLLLLDRSPSKHVASFPQTCLSFKVPTLRPSIHPARLAYTLLSNSSFFLSTSRLSKPKRESYCQCAALDLVLTFAVGCLNCRENMRTRDILSPCLKPLRT